MLKTSIKDIVLSCYQYFKVEYQTPNRNIHVLEILKTSLDDIVIACHAITDKHALLKKLRALYKPSKEELAEARAKYQCDDTRQYCVGLTHEELFERELKKYESRHISRF